MKFSVQNTIDYFSRKPRTLFLIDGLGAFVTALLLLGFVRQFDAFFGIPKSEVTCLALIAVCFCIYSTTCYFLLKRGLSSFMRFIAIVNLLYCTLTIGLLIKNASTVTILGTTYFLIEIVIICGLSYIELNVAKRINDKQIT